MDIFFNGIKHSEADVVFAQLKFVYSKSHFEIMNPRDPYDTGQNLDIGVQLSGAFCVRTSIFRIVNGFDSKLSYAENTELFWRLNQLNISKHIADKITIIVNRENNRSSIAPQNIVTSLGHILEKHNIFLKTQPHIKWLYLNNLGVALAKTGNRSKAINCFYEALWVKPLRWKPFLRIVITLLNRY